MTPSSLAFSLALVRCAAVRYLAVRYLVAWTLVGTSLLLVGCDGSKDATFKALDKHAAEYGRCGAMKEAKGDIGGQPAWIAANVCEVKLRQTVAKEIEDFDGKAFQKHYEEWIKENGEKAVAAQRGKPITPDAAPAPAGGGMSETERLKIVNECNLQVCTTTDRLSPAHTTCMEGCCRSKGMKQNCRE